MVNNTPFDDAYKTLIEKYPKLIIPVINEQFGRNYAEDEIIENLSQEIQKPEGDIAADSIFKIGDRMYHVECQSNPDGTMAVRMLEYDFYVAMRNVAKDEKGQYSIEFPKSAVLYLRHNSNTSDEATIKVKVSEDISFDYKVPIIKTQHYSLDEIFRKKLYILLPFYLLRYEKEIDKIESDDVMLNQIVDEYRGLIEELDNVYGEKERLLVVALEQQMKELVNYMFEQQNEAKNRIGGAIMGGTVMKTIGDELEELRNTVKEKNDELKEKDDELKEKDDVIKEKDDELKEKDNVLKEKDYELEKALAEIERLKKMQNNK